MQYHRQHTDYTTGHSFCSFRPLHRDPTRHQLTKQQCKVRKHNCHQHNCQHMTNRKAYAACSQPFIQPCHQFACKSVRSSRCAFRSPSSASSRSLFLFSDTTETSDAAKKALTRIRMISNKSSFTMNLKSLLFLRQRDITHWELPTGYASYSFLQQSTDSVHFVL